MFRGLTNIRVTAVQDGLIAPAVLTDPSQCLDDAQANLLPLNVLVHRDILDVSDVPESAQELALYEDTSDADDSVRIAVDNDECVVGVRALLLLVELRNPGLFAGIGDHSQHGQDLQVASPVVRRCQWANLRLRKWRSHTKKASELTCKSA